jgi:hypothetical protein
MKIGDILLSISDNVQRPLKPVFEDDMRSNQQLPARGQRGPDRIGRGKQASCRNERWYILHGEHRCSEDLEAQ